EVLSENEIIHQVRGLAQPARTTAAQRFELLVADRLVQLRAERAAVLQPDPPGPPQPQLRAADLGRRGILHEVVDGRRAVPAQPAVEVGQGDGDVRADAGLADRPAWDREVEQLFGRDLQL